MQPTSDNSSNQVSMRCATASIREAIPWGEGGSEIKHGTKHFRGGAKVYIIDYYPGMCESVVVVGHHRASGRYIRITVRARWLEGFRMTTAYSPKVIDLICEHYSLSAFTYHEARAEELLEATSRWVSADQ